jgi:hypothetical protein
MEKFFTVEQLSKIFFHKKLVRMVRGWNRTGDTRLFRPNCVPVIPFIIMAYGRCYKLLYRKRVGWQLAGTLNACFIVRR